MLSRVRFEFGPGYCCLLLCCCCHHCRFHQVINHHETISSASFVVTSYIGLCPDDGLQPFSVTKGEIQFILLHVKVERWAWTQNSMRDGKCKNENMKNCPKRENSFLCWTAQLWTETGTRRFWFIIGRQNEIILMASEFSAVVYA